MGVNSIETPPLPDIALLQKYANGVHYTDCFAKTVPMTVSFAEYVSAFYTTWLFKLERVILRWLARLPSSDEDVRELLASQRETFAAWTLEGRAGNQLLMCDVRERTRSWFMSEPGADGASTRLYFGSAVTAVEDKNADKPSLGPTYSALLGFHRLYSRALLAAAARKLTV